MGDRLPGRAMDRTQPFVDLVDAVLGTPLLADVCLRHGKRADRVAAGHTIPQDVRKAERHPSDGEERRLGTVAGGRVESSLLRQRLPWQSQSRGARLSTVSSQKGGIISPIGLNPPL